MDREPEDVSVKVESIQEILQRLIATVGMLERLSQGTVLDSEEWQSVLADLSSLKQLSVAQGTEFDDSIMLARLFNLAEEQPGGVFESMVKGLLENGTKAEVVHEMQKKKIQREEST